MARSFKTRYRHRLYGEPVDEFASGTLVAAVLRSLAAEGLPVAAVPVRDALVPLAVKQGLLAEITRSYGPAPLLRAGSPLPHGPGDPVLAALRAASGPAGLFERWQRLERFPHSGHHVLVRVSERSRLTAEHVGPPGRPPASAVTGTARWHFAWTAVTPRPPAASAVSTDLAARAGDLLGGDLARRWTLAGLATDLAVPVRALRTSPAPRRRLHRAARRGSCRGRRHRRDPRPGHRKDLRGRRRGAPEILVGKARLLPAIMRVAPGFGYRLLRDG